MKKYEDILIDGFITTCIVAVAILLCQCILVVGSGAIIGAKPELDAEAFAWFLLGDMLAGLLVTVYLRIKDKLENF